MDKSLILRLVLIGAIAVLIVNTLAISRDYQDTWILEGLEIPFILFVAIYLLTFFSEKRASWMVVVAAIGRCVFLLIPNLKYVWFQGAAVDQHQQYGLANHLYTEGYIADQGYGPILIYGNTPLIHLTFAIFSIVSNVPVVDSVKYVPVFLTPLYPLLTYVIIKNLNLPHGTTVLKYALFFSSIPVSPDNYLVTGTHFGALLVFIILTCLVTLLQKNDRRRLFILIFLISVLPVAHSSSSLLLALILLAVALLQTMFGFRLKSYLHTTGIFTVVSTSFAWLIFKARFTFEMIVEFFVLLPTGLQPPGAKIPPRFLELFGVDVLGALRTILVFYGADVFLLLLTLCGVVILVKMLSQLNSASKFLFLLSIVMLGLVSVEIPVGISGFRALRLARPLFAVFSGLFVMYMGKRRVWLSALIISSLLLLASIELYGFQPFIPSANVLLKDLPADEPLVYVTDVNSIYQRQMIEFAADHLSGRTTSDVVTQNQIVGLTPVDFLANIIRGYNPLDKTRLERKYDYLLIHLPGVSGRFGEPAEMRTKDAILGIIYNSSIIYTNGESYILTPNAP